MKYLNYILKWFRDPLFILSIVVALSAWYFNRLNATFERDTTIPLHIDGAVNPFGVGDNSYFKIFCRVRAKGYSFLQLKLFPTSKLAIISLPNIIANSGNVGEPDANRNISIDIASIEGEIAGKVKGVDILKIYDTQIKMPMLNNIQKRVKISPNIKLNVKGGYMQLGKVELEPSSLLIYGDRSLVEKIDSVVTVDRVINNGYSAIISDEIELKKEQGVNFSTDKVVFRIATDRFTEKKYIVKPLIERCDSNVMRLEMFPRHVEVKFNCAQSLFASFSEKNFKIYVDYCDDNGIGDDKYEVKVLGLPIGASLQSINPQFVTILKGE